jgi:hypothetical protein
MQLDEGDEFVAPAGVVAAPATEQPAPEDDNTVKAPTNPAHRADAESESEA